MARPFLGDFIEWHATATQKLQQLGFPRDRAEKALVDTGHSDIQTAVQWLKSHAADVSVSKPFAREYVLFLAPAGVLSNHLEQFWKESFRVVGRNAAHALFPHVTLSSFFKVQDHQVPNMLNILSNVVTSMERTPPSKLRLFFHKTEGYIGLFLEEDGMNWVKDGVEKFVKRMYDKMGIQMQPHGRQLHMSLGYQFDADQQKFLETLARKIDVEAPVEWQLRLYSRDPRYSACDVSKVIHTFLPRSKSDLQLSTGQHVYMSTERTIFSGWKKGTCFETGLNGSFPDNYVEKAEAWTCWIQHCSIPVLSVSPPLEERLPERQLTLEKMNGKTNGDLILRANSPAKNTLPQSRYSYAETGKKKPLGRTVSAHPQVYSSQADNGEYSHKEHSKAQTTKASEPRIMSRARSIFGSSHRDTKSEPSASPHSNRLSQTDPLTPKIKARQFLLMRHAERVDIVFGHEWTQQQFDSSGFYARTNLNLPRVVPNRAGGPDTFYQDSPITEMGKCQARLIGEELRLRNVTVNAAYSSPALRSIQTTQSILIGMKLQDKIPIRIEFGLYEWLAWCRGVMPKWMTLNELHEFGIDIDFRYKSCIQIKNLKITETAEQFYNRSYSVVKSIGKTIEDGNVLVVGHAATLDACTRLLIGEHPRAHEDLVRIVQKVPYCGLATAKEYGKGTWKLVEPPIPSLSHGTNGKFDWKTLLPIEVKKPGMFHV